MRSRAAGTLCSRMERYAFGLEEPIRLAFARRDNAPVIAEILGGRVIHSSYYQVFSDGNSGDWIGEMLSTFPQPKMNIY